MAKSMVMAKSLSFDLTLPQGAHSELSTSDAVSGWRAIEAAVGLADELGYRGVWACDRIDPLPRRARIPVFDGWTTLAAAAKITDRLRLGLVGSLGRFRDALQFAKHASSLDVISGGRVSVALDASHNGERGDHADAEIRVFAAEVAGALRLLWDTGSATYRGRYVELDQAFCHPRPVQPRLALLASGGAEQDLPPDVFDGVIRREDPQSLRDILAAAGGDRRTIMSLDVRLFDSGLERDRWLGSPHVIIFWSDHPDVYVRRNLVGTVDAVRARLQEYVDLGLTEFALYFRDYPSLHSVHRFMTEVVPGLVPPRVAPDSELVGVD
jgi:alkanesulfonate monooxygenase SsuD/methylene tetrahydromethanopterin reductase-like flavin-dependent oxidoreductase (luciferase family)